MGKYQLSRFSAGLDVLVLLTMCNHQPIYKLKFFWNCYII